MIVPESLRHISNFQLLFDFFEEAMAGVILVHAALNNFANERIPRDFVLTEGSHSYTRDQIIEQKGIEMRLSRILQQATRLPNLMAARPDLWSRFQKLKALRDATEHANDGSEGYAFEEEQGTIFAKLLSETNLVAYAELVREIIDIYRPRHLAQDLSPPS